MNPLETEFSAVRFDLPNPWPNCPGLPRSASAALAALHLTEPRIDALAGFSDREWDDALAYCDRSRLTLAFGDAAAAVLPARVRERLDANAARNAERIRRMEQLYRELSASLDAGGVPFLALKGLTHGAWFGIRPERRQQYDIDLFSPPERVHAARDVLLGLGYEPIEGTENFPTDHLPSMVRKTAWEWRGDYFDVEIPTPVELHFQLWNGDVERLTAPGTEAFWDRRVTRTVAGIEMPVLRAPDALAFAALHLLKHILRGSSHPSHVDAPFWEEWSSLHGLPLRRLEAVIFRLSREWFGCRLAPHAAEEIERLPAATRAWFDEFATAPARSEFDSNKDELWLHLTLLESRGDAWNVIRRRLFPANLPLRAGTGHVTESERTLRRRLRTGMRYAGHTLSRTWHHAVALPRTAASGMRWWRRMRKLAPGQTTAFSK
jgi:hypothetical protein